MPDNFDENVIPCSVSPCKIDLYLIIVAANFDSESAEERLRACPLTQQINT